MKLATYTITILTVISSTFANYKCNTKQDHEGVAQITQYEVEIPSSFEKHTGGFPTGIGSGITFKGITRDGNIELYALADRGPSDTVIGTDCIKDTIIFPKPDFSPFIGVVCIIPGKSATLTEVIPLKIDGQMINGLPIHGVEHERNLPIPTDLNFKVLPGDPRGFDLESIDTDGEGNFWLGDEYRPSLVKARITTGEIIDILTPGNGLPEILKHYRENRAFESLAITPNGTIYAVLESTLFEESVNDSVNFVRIIELNPKTKRTRTFAYLFDKNEYSSKLSTKIGDVAAIDDTHFLIIEQGKTPFGMRNIVYVIDISNATDITDMTLPNGLPLEHGCLHELSNIQFTKKSLLFNANNYGWLHEKLEGIAIINPRTIAITNDNDFGFSLTINGTSTLALSGYSVDYKTQKLLYCGKETQDKIDSNIKKDVPTNIWIVEFQKNLLDFMETRSNDL